MTLTPLIHRNTTVDLIRTLAIALMVIFHFIYDLKFFGYHAYDIPDGFGWKHFRYVILTLFFICVGVGLVYAHRNGLKLEKFLKRLLWVFLGAMAVTVMSLFMFPANWIYFGVLHFIVVASLLALPLVNYPKVALGLGIAMIAAFNMGWIVSWWPFVYIEAFLPKYSNDWVPLIPWLGVVWLGIALGHSDWLGRDPLAKFSLPDWLAKPGQHSLVIYLVHQPVFFACLAVAGLFTGKQL